MKYLSCILLSVAVGLIIFLIGYNTGLKKHIPEVEYIQGETITDTIRDTIRIDRPIPQFVTRTEERVDTVIHTVIEKDTVEIPLQFPIVEKAYEDTVYKAIIKGVEFGSYPCLQSLEIYQTNTCTTNTVKIESKRNMGFRINVGAYAGYGLLNRRPDIFIGGGIGYVF